MQIAFVDDLEHQVGGVATDGEIPDLIDHENGRVRVERQRPRQLAATHRDRERLDHLGGAGAQRLVAVLDGAIGDGDPEVGLAGAGGPAQDQAPALADQLRPEVAAEQLQTHRGLEREVEVLDGAQEREASLPDRALDAGLGAMRDLLGDERGEEVAVGLVLGLGADLALGIEPAHGRQVQALEHAVEIERMHQATSFASRRSTCGAP
jgi:hypothetical protein